MDCSVKKKPGKLNLSLVHISWQANDGSTREQLKLMDVKGMQATPPTAAKMRIKLTLNDGQALMLEFGSAGALEKAKTALQSAIKGFREGAQAPQAPQAPSPAQQPQQQPAQQPAQQQQQTNSNSIDSQQPPLPTLKKPKTKKISLDPARLLNNLDLQQTLLKQDPDLMKTFQQTVISSGALTNEQFWSLRMHLLITAAQQQIQQRGSYNVLSTIKPTTGSDNRININLTREKISDMFDQYPLVRKAYNDNVPKLSEGEFWQRFFMSRLFLVLRGEKVSQNHTTDAILDPYIDLLSELQERKQQSQKETKPVSNLFVNVEANDNNNYITKGNDLVTTAGGGTKTLIRSVNQLSHRLLLGKRRREQYEEHVMQDLVLHDLEPVKNVNSNLVELSLNALNTSSSRDTNNAQFIENCTSTFKNQTPNLINLSTVMENEELLAKALNRVISLTPQNTNLNANDVVRGDVQLVNATTLEFLKQFWHAYHQNPELVANLRKFLEKSLERIEAVHSDLLDQVVLSVKHALEVTK